MVVLDSSKRVAMILRIFETGTDSFFKESETVFDFIDEIGLGVILGDSLIKEITSFLVILPLGPEPMISLTSTFFSKSNFFSQR